MENDYFFSDFEFEPSIEYHYIDPETLLYLAKHYDWCQENMGEPIINYYNKEQGDVRYV